MGAGTGPGPLDARDPGNAGNRRNIAAPSVETDNRRDSVRLPILGDLRGEMMVHQPMGVTELGRGGVQVETTFPLHLDSVHDLRLDLGTRTLIVKGRITHCTIVDVDQELVRYRSGIQFVDLPGRAAAVIAAFLGDVTNSRELRT